MERFFEYDCQFREDDVSILNIGELGEVISVTPAMRPSERSRGVATVAAIVSGLAPGRLADTEIVGKSTCGNGETGSNRNAVIPASMIASINRVVAIGR